RESEYLATRSRSGRTASPLVGRLTWHVPTCLTLDELFNIGVFEQPSWPFDAGTHDDVAHCSASDVYAQRLSRASQSRGNFRCGAQFLRAGAIGTTAVTHGYKPFPSSCSGGDNASFIVSP